ncbi:(d)CMP kinase [Sediminicola luteus]|uniref:Cytidylate kinase n=1 Tax=Sediminicola luteus TaxID=319238 RepID=A0A2A4GAL8_9FLAO|nr:(d)CMP kinase [Sediminicola luteus]PCE65020.1 cytidylate kinase [Sediminicola luteus]
MKITIAIDGFSSTGKSTIAKMLAEKLEYVYIDTGAMYRAVTLFAIRIGAIDDSKQLDTPLLESQLDAINLRFERNGDTGKADMILNGENVEREIRTMAVSTKVSIVSELAAVREKLVAEQRRMGADKGVVMDGRDIGTVVFPDAELKIFMTASASARAHRRYKELLDRGDDVNYDEILKNVQERDYIDSHREHSPLKQAEDAVPFDNSHMGLEDQFERIYSLAQDRIGG